LGLEQVRQEYGDAYKGSILFFAKAKNVEAFIAQAADLFTDRINWFMFSTVCFDF
jgi:hypothetical protein